MKSKRADMQDIFCKLTESNKDILILKAQNIKSDQETDKRDCKSCKQER